jgi:transposase-like protein
MTYGCAEPIVPLAREGNRRKFSEADKRRIVEQAVQPGASLSEVARRYGIAARVLFRWKQELMQVAPLFVAVEIADATPSTEEPAELEMLGYTLLARDGRRPTRPARRSESEFRSYVIDGPLPIEDFVAAHSYCLSPMPAFRLSVSLFGLWPFFSAVHFPAIGRLWPVHRSATGHEARESLNGGSANDGGAQILCARRVPHLIKGP